MYIYLLLEALKYHLNNQTFQLPAENYCENNIFRVRMNKK